MITLSNRNKTIQLSISEVIREEKKSNTEYAYIPELPTIVCNNRDDVKYIQKQINAFTNNLIKDIVKEKGVN